MLKRLILECPECKKTKIQKIPENLMEKRNQIEKGICGILIPENTICNHGFIVYIDTNFSIRDVISLKYAQDLNMKKVIQLKTIEELVSSLTPKTLKSILNNL
jgi:hypothetical protein